VQIAYLGAVARKSLTFGISYQCPAVEIPIRTNGVGRLRQVCEIFLFVKEGQYKMPVRFVLLIVITMFVLSLTATDNLLAGNIYGSIHQDQPYYLDNPKRIEVEQTRNTSDPKSGNAVSAVAQSKLHPRAYPYGYFGAQYRPYSTTRTRDYFNSSWQWSFARGY
jgi:hypothetical protein